MESERDDFLFLCAYSADFGGTLCLCHGCVREMIEQRIHHPKMGNAMLPLTINEWDALTLIDVRLEATTKMLFCFCFYVLCVGVATTKCREWTRGTQHNLPQNDKCAVSAIDFWSDANGTGNACALILVASTRIVVRPLIATIGAAESSSTEKWTNQTNRHWFNENIRPKIIIIFVCAGTLWFFQSSRYDAFCTENYDIFPCIRPNYM